VVSHLPTPVVDIHTATVEGDPHYTVAGTTWSEHGVAEDTYLLASGNGVMVTGLYVENGYDYCVIGAVQVVVQADAATGAPEVRVQFNLADTSHVIVNGTQMSLQGFNHVYGGGVTIAQEQGGSGLVVTTHTSDGKVGQYTVDGGAGRGCAVSVNGAFDNAGGIINYLGANDAQGKLNVTQNADTINTYVENNFNLTALGFSDGVIDKSVWPPGTRVGW